MTFNISSAIESAQRIAEARKRSAAAVAGQRTRRHGAENYMGSALERAHNSLASLAIEMHITPWWKDENGIPTRQIWAKGSIIER